MDFHPFGDFFASGSLDTSVKVWDVRRKTCINTYKEHRCGVVNVQFSPDGRLVASGGQNGDVKVVPGTTMQLHVASSLTYMRKITLTGCEALDKSCHTAFHAAITPLRWH